MIAEYETSSVDTLENYSVVQFIRGCMFDLLLENPYNRKEEMKNYLWTKDQFGGRKRYIFPNWVIDSFDKDPVYHSNNLGRFDGRRWSKTPGYYDTRTAGIYGEEKPPRPILFSPDHPGGGMVTENFGIKTAINTSLEFQTCIYKTKDIPLETTEDDLNFAEPIHCFLWRSSYIYNTETKEFDSPLQIAPICLEKTHE